MELVLAESALPPTPEEYGVGARVSLQPMSDRFIDIILGALDDAGGGQGTLRITTGVVSTLVSGGDEEALARYLTALIAAAARRSAGAHLTAQVMLSRGCPGEIACAFVSGPWGSEKPVVLEPTGVQVVAEWSLYPLLGVIDDTDDHMMPIMAAIDAAKVSGLFDSSDHYVTRLAGDLAEVIALVVTAWRRTGSWVQHVTTHLALSINSPTARSNS